MAEHRKVPFVTLSAFSSTTATAAPSAGSEARKRRVDADAEPRVSRETGLGAPEAPHSGKAQRHTVRININLPESNELSFPEYSYSELLQTRKSSPAVKQTHGPYDDEQRQKQEAEALARKFEDKYGSGCRTKHKDRVQDLIDIGFGYDENDSFIDNSEAYDELVPASLTTKLGGFYINTGTLQFRNTSETESDDGERTADTSKGDEESEVKKRKRRDEAELEDEEKKKMKNNRLTKSGAACRLEKKSKKLMLASMLKRFVSEKKEMSKLNLTHNTQLLHGDFLLSDLTSDPATMSLLTSANESELQDLLNDLDFSSLDSAPQMNNGLMCTGASLRTADGACVNPEAEIVCPPPPPLPKGLPAPLVKRIEDLRAASRQFDEEGRKKFFTLDMNNILLDIELQVQQQSPSVRSAVYSHLEAFVPCNKEALLKRLKKLSLNIQDDRLRTPLLKLKLAVCSVMPEQTARYNMDCMAKVAAKQQMEDGERNVSEDEEEEKPGKRVMGPRKKFIWDDKLRTLLCNLVRVKLRCYEQEKSSLSVEDYLKVFMENEVKPLWPKGWMQARMLFKESRTVHGHLTDLVKKRIFSTPKPVKEMGFDPVPCVSPAPFSHLPSETICLSDSLDEDLATNSLESIAQALTLLNGINPNSAPSTSSTPPVVAKPHPHTASPTPSSQSSMPKDVSSVQRQTVTPASKPSNTSTTTPAAKPRPPPTTTPLQKPFGTVGIKSGGATPPTAQIKNPSKKLCVDGGAQKPSLNSLNPKSFHQVTTPSSPLPFIQKKATPTGHHQQRFITPMQATITKSSQSSNSPIIKLTHRPPAQTTPSGSTHRPPAQTTPSGSTHRPPAQTTPSGSTHCPPAQTTPSGSTHRLPAQPMLSVSAHRPPVQSPAHQPPTLTVPPGSTHRSSVSTPSPPTTVHHPSITTPTSGHINRPSASNSQNIGPAHHAPASKPPASSSTHRSLVSTPPSPSSHRTSVQTPPSSAYRPSVPTPPPNLTHRSPVTTPPSVSSPAPSSCPPVLTPPTQYNPKSSGFKPPFSHAPVATPHTSSFQGCNLTSTSVATNHGQRQRSVGGANQSNMSANCASSMGLPSLSDSALLNQVSSVPLGLGMFGGLVPVSLPFQFPLLNFAPAGAATHPPSSGYTLSPNLFKSLQSGVQALPPHLQLAFSESNQSQGGDVKRK
ncbi:ubinuclein-2a isoform X1 [Tachysurus vachellii]|uniref:ubinuclein-2a isoform X1 n=1 Tax=Tachysurus vachellii TaxID=175792 RepID=UPI00296B1E4D|nr:ubinuclein-2a isoform X1 [Tachysurus vachellii]XP_060725072.1 ubinuclein-2a isoform X1 [Tachysurus vachellii]